MLRRATSRQEEPPPARPGGRLAPPMRPGQADRERGVAPGEVVAEETELGRRPGGQQDDVGVAVQVVVEDRERASVLVEVQTRAARDLVEAAPAVVAQEHVALVLGLRAV